jgi:hypothetical protein
MIIWLILCIILFVVVLLFYKSKYYFESFVIDETNPTNKTSNVSLDDSNRLIELYKSYFNYDELMGDVVKDNTYYNTLMFKSNDIDFKNLTTVFNNMNNANNNLKSTLNTFNTTNVVELNNRIKNTTIQYVWSIETSTDNIDKLNTKYDLLLEKLKIVMPEYIQNNSSYNYITNSTYYNNYKKDLSIKSSIANTIILGFDNLTTSNMTTLDDMTKLNYIKSRMNNFGDLPGIGETYSALNNFAKFTPSLPADKYVFLQNYNNYNIEKTPEYNNYFQNVFIPSVAYEFISLYSGIISNMNSFEMTMSKTYIQYVYDYLTNEMKTAINTLTTMKTEYITKKQLYEKTLEDYENSSSSSTEAKNKFEENKATLNQSYLTSVKNVINEQQNNMKTKLNDALKQQWELDEAQANKAVTKNVLSATQSLKNQIQASNELTELINKQQSMLYDDAYSTDQLNKFNEGQSQFLSLDSYRTGIMNRYKDPSCNDDSYIYCEGGEIECQDVFGNKMPDKLQQIRDDYEYGNTYSKCGSSLSQVELKELAKDMSGVILPGNIGFYYDISGTTCSSENPWAVGGDGYIVAFDACYKTEEEASNRLNMLRNYNSTDLTNDAVVYIDGDYLVNEYMVENPASKSIIYRQKTMWMDGRRHFKGVIDKLDTNNLFNVYIPDKKTGVLFKGIPSKNMNTLNTDYITNKNKYLSNMKNGDLPRPVCKGGRFTTKCSVKPPYNPKTGEPYEIDPTDTEQRNINNTTNDKGEPIVKEITTFNMNEINEYIPSALNSTVGYSSYN